MARLQALYKSEIISQMFDEFKYKNRMEVPRLEKIVVSMGIGRAIQDKKLLENAAVELTQITGQKPLYCAARVSVSNFKLRQGSDIGLKVTLRKQRMYEFLDRLISLAIPRIRDFRGLNPKCFDGRGNYSLGITEQAIFPEIDPDRIANVQGMNIAMVTTAKTDEEGRKLLQLFGMPFKNLN